MDKDLLFEKRMKDLASRAYNRDIVLYTDFLNLDEYCEKLLQMYGGLKA